MTKKLKTRFAPSPTGYLHIGHALSAYYAYSWAKQNDAEFILRIEDIDPTRCKSIYTDAILEDLEWLGIEWSGEVIHQSKRIDIYQQYINELEHKDLLYPCFATRNDIKKCGDNKVGVDGIIYPSIWTHATQAEIDEQIKLGNDYCKRIKINDAFKYCKEPYFNDVINATMLVNPDMCGDVVIARKETPTSYHLSCVVDDHLQGITNIIRGEDLFGQTHIHRILQSVFGFENPTYHHHKLITDTDGKKVSKSNITPSLKKLTIKHLREVEKLKPDEVLNMIVI